MWSALGQGLSFTPSLAARDAERAEAAAKDVRTMRGGSTSSRIWEFPLLLNELFVIVLLAW